jgi:hypothetical protein
VQLHRLRSPAGAGGKPGGGRGLVRLTENRLHRPSVSITLDLATRLDEDGRYRDAVLATDRLARYRDRRG